MDIDNDVRSRPAGLMEYLRIEETEDSTTLTHELSELKGTLPADHEAEILNPEHRSIFKTAGAESLFQETRISMRTYANGPEEFWKRIDWRGKHYRIQGRRVILSGHAYWTMVGASTDQALRTLRQLGLLMLAGIPGVVLIAACGGYWLSGRALAPVASMTHAARLIGIQDLSRRLPLPGGGDEIQQLAETWNAMLGRLEIAVMRISQFTSDASHELRTPIALIRSTAEIALRRDRPETRYRDALEQIEGESERMTQLVGDLLFLARADAHAVSAEMTSVDLREPMQAACRGVAPLARAHGVDLDVREYPDIIAVIGRESALRRVFIAIIENAVKYTPPKGRVTVSLEAAAGNTILAVSDTGIGIPASALPHVFERFFRADPSRNRGSGGHGLGLSIAQTIARQHQGIIEVESEIGAGSVFRVTLPLATDGAD